MDRKWEHASSSEERKVATLIAVSWDETIECEISGLTKYWCMSGFSERDWKKGKIFMQRPGWGNLF